LCPGSYPSRVRVFFPFSPSVNSADGRFLLFFFLNWLVQVQSLPPASFPSQPPASSRPFPEEHHGALALLRVSPLVLVPKTIFLYHVPQIPDFGYQPFFLLQGHLLKTPVGSKDLIYCRATSLTCSAYLVSFYSPLLGVFWLGHPNT